MDWGNRVRPLEAHRILNKQRSCMCSVKRGELYATQLTLLGKYVKFSLTPKCNKPEKKLTYGMETLQKDFWTAHSYTWNFIRLLSLWYKMCRAYMFEKSGLNLKQLKRAQTKKIDFLYGFMPLKLELWSECSIKKQNFLYNFCTAEALPYSLA